MDHTPHGRMCSMNMQWNVDPTGICLVFPSLQITGKLSLFFSCLFLVGLSLLFEFVRMYINSSDRSARAVARYQAVAGGRPRSPAQGQIEEGLLGRRGGSRQGMSGQARKSALYVVQVALSFYLMLIIMSYNAVLISAVLIGAFLGHFCFARETDISSEEDLGARGLSCH